MVVVGRAGLDENRPYAHIYVTNKALRTEREEERNVPATIAGCAHVCMTVVCCEGGFRSLPLDREKSVETDKPL